MNHRKKYTLIASVLCLVVLILDGKTALQGASSGIALCIKSVIPSLLPFFVLSIYLTGGLIGVKSTFLAPVKKIFRVPNGTESLLLIGFLGGYPVGAKTVHTAYTSAGLSRQNAERMLMFCNNAGPAFLFGMVSMFFPKHYTVWLLWGIQLFSAMLVSRTAPLQPSKTVIGPSYQSISFSESVNRTIHIMASVCCWIVLFRVILAYLEKWTLGNLPVWFQVLFSGILELSNGCVRLGEIENEAIRFIVCSVLLSFGGFCVTFQTASVIGDLDFRMYVKGKLFQTGYALILSLIIQNIFSLKRYTDVFPTVACILILIFSVTYCKNKSRFPNASGV